MRTCVHQSYLVAGALRVCTTVNAVMFTSLRTVADGVNSLRSPERAIVVITHYQRLLNYIVPDRVHVLLDGRVVRSGGRELALELEESGYGAFGHLAAQVVA